MIIYIFLEYFLKHLCEIVHAFSFDTELLFLNLVYPRANYVIDLHDLQQK